MPNATKTAVSYEQMRRHIQKSCQRVTVTAPTETPSSSGKSISYRTISRDYTEAYPFTYSPLSCEWHMWIERQAGMQTQEAMRNTSEQMFSCMAPCDPSFLFAMVMQAKCFQNNVHTWLWGAIEPATRGGELMGVQKAKKNIHWHCVRFGARRVHTMHVIHLGAKREITNN